MQGKIKKFISDRGFGFIAQDRGGDVFFHISSLGGVKEVSPGERVSFDVEESERGPRAVNVMLLGVP